jgi:hypothetical protein
MEASNGKPRRVDIGFEGGGVMTVRLEEDAYRSLRSALEGESSWHQFQSEDSEVTIDLSKVVYVRLDTGQRGVGFSGA